MINKVTTTIQSLLILFIIGGTCVYILFNNLSTRLISGITLNLNLSSPGCLEMKIQPELSQSLNQTKLAPQTIPLNPEFQIYPIEVSPIATRINLSFCDGIPVYIKQIYFTYRGRDINLSLTDSKHLNCVTCLMQNDPEGDLKLSPNPESVTLQILNIKDYVNLFFKNALTIIYRLPHLVILCFLLLILISALPLTITIIEFIFYSLTISLAFFRNWEKLRQLFPPAGYTQNQIIAYAQFTATPLNADTLLIGLLLLLICLIYFLLHLRTKYCQQKHLLQRNYRIITVIVFFAFILLFLNFI